MIHDASCSDTFHTYFFFDVIKVGRVCGITKIETQFISENGINLFLNATSSNNTTREAFSFNLKLNKELNYVKVRGISLCVRCMQGWEEEERWRTRKLVATRCVQANWKHHFKSSPLNDSQTQSIRFTSSRCVKAKVNEFDYLLGFTHKYHMHHYT